MLNEESPDLKEVAEALDDIIGEDQRAGEVIHRLRGLLKNREPVFEVVDVNEVIRSTMQILHNEVITRRIRVTTSLANSLPGVAGDAVQLQQVLLNLVLNAMSVKSATTNERLIIKFLHQRRTPA